MDPLSIAAGASALATFAVRASLALYSSIEAVRNADSTLTQLHSEVEALASGLENIASTFIEDEVVQACRSKTGSISQLSKLTDGVHVLLADCEKTLGKLGAILEGVDKPGPLRGMLRKSVKALKINLRTGDIELIRHQLRSYSSALQMTLQMLAICMLVSGNGRVEDLGLNLSNQITNLTQQIQELKTKVMETNTGLSQGANQPELKHYKQNMGQYIVSAAKILSDASVYADSVAGTVVGDDLDTGILPEESRKYQEDRTKEEENSSLDDRLFKSRVKVAQSKLSTKEYETAIDHFEKCLGDSRAAALPLHEVVDLKLDLATAYQGIGNTTKQASILLSLGKLDLPKSQMLHLKHNLAIFYARDYQLIVARKYAEENVKERLQLLGSGHRSYHDSVNLLVNICRAQNDSNNADIYHNLLPQGYEDDSPEGLGFQVNAASIRGLDALNKAGFNIAKFDAQSLNDNHDLYYKALNWANKHDNNDALTVLLARVRHLKSKRGLSRLKSSFRGASWSTSQLLYMAAMVGLPEAVTHLIAQGADVNQVDTNKCTVLHVAIRSEPTVKVLLRHGAKPNNRDRKGTTPLMEAARHKNSDTLKALLDSGADITPSNDLREDALLIAVMVESVECVRLILEADKTTNHFKAHRLENHLVVASGRSQTETVRLLLDHGAKCNVETYINGVYETPLNKAATLGYVDTVKLLLARGADVNHTESMFEGLTSGHAEDTALFRAVANGHVEVVRALLKAGAKPNVLCSRQTDGVQILGNYSPLMLAISKGFVEIVGLLIENGADTTVSRRPRAWDNFNSLLNIFTFIGDNDFPRKEELIQVVETSLRKKNSKV